MASVSGGRGKSRLSRADNLDVMRCYFRATAPGQPTRGYIKRMHQEWTKLRPDRLVTEQRLSDQYRFVKRSRKFGQEELDELQRGETPEVRGPRVLSSLWMLNVAAEAEITMCRLMKFCCKLYFGRTARWK